MPLLISAQLGNEELYHFALKRMSSAMEKVEQGPFKAWLYGRILFAADSIDDHQTVSNTLAYLNTLFDTLLENDTTKLDKFNAWSLGYVTALNKEEYSKRRELMKNAADYSTKKYFQINTINASNEKIQEARSDAIWAWVMSSQAAANAGELNAYTNAIEQILAITEQTSISDALQNGLLRTDISNNYPAWAIIIVRLAAQKMSDDARFKALEAPLLEAISRAKFENRTEEVLLALVNSQLAIERAKV